MLKGIAAAPGIGMGRVIKVSSAPITIQYREPENIENEIQKFINAIDTFCENTEEMAEEIRKTTSDHEAEILMGHITMIKDPFMSSQIEEMIKSGKCAEEAVTNVLDSFIEMFKSTGDELTMQRATDIEDIKNRIIRILTGTPEIDFSKAPRGTIIITDDLTPSMTVGITKDRIAGIVTEEGGYTSHSAILSRALEIPAVLGVPNILSLLGNGDQLIIDGSNGEVITDPSLQDLELYKSRSKEFTEHKLQLQTFIGAKSVTKSGEVKEIFANIGNAADGIIAKSDDAEGIGLFRTEFLYMERSSAPTEDEQFMAYKKVAETFGDKPVIIRTLDVGGDKHIQYLNIKKEDNPFMGYRAVRYCLKHEEIFKPQLRALLRAGAYGNIRIMIPMVTSLEELRSVKKLKEKCCRELAAENHNFNENTEIGIMVETPAALMMADLFAKEADFFSIGTNDLTGYLMAADRGNSKVANLYTTFDPAVLRGIKHICSCAQKAGIPVGMCGEAAADKLLTPLLLAFGLDEFSVSHEMVLETRSNISKWNLEEAKAVAEKVMSLDTSKAVRKYLTELISNK